jgi:hypothetical protein
MHCAGGSGSILADQVLSVAAAVPFTLCELRNKTMGLSKNGGNEQHAPLHDLKGV